MLSCAALTVRGRARVRTDRVQPVMSIPAVSMLIGVPVMKGTSNSAHTFVLMSGRSSTALRLLSHAPHWPS